MARRRLDAELVRRELVPSRETARRLIAARRVLVDGAFADKPARLVDPGQSVELVGEAPRFVSRAGEKLAGALDEFDVDSRGLRCLDAGSSTGGFTDCLLQAGAATVVAVDVGTNQLHEKIRGNGRVEVHERTDIRSVSADELGGRFDLIVADLSFISIRLVLPTLAGLLAEGGRMVVLIKPQFEAGRQEAAKGRGVITDPDIWRRVLDEVLGDAAERGLALRALAPSTVPGATGNIEFVAQLDHGQSEAIDRSGTIESVVFRLMSR